MTVAIILRVAVAGAGVVPDSAVVVVVVAVRCILFI